MKRESIKSQTKSALISACFNFAVRIVVVFLVIGNIQRIEEHFILHAITLLGLVGVILQIIFLPFSTWCRIKEIKKGEIYEASEY